MNRPYWTQRYNQLKTDDPEVAEALSWFLEQDDFIGSGDGQLRPGELGKWDFYYFLLQAGFGPEPRAAKAAELDLEKIRCEENAANARMDDMWRSLARLN